MLRQKIQSARTGSDTEDDPDYEYSSEMSVDSEDCLEELESEDDAEMEGDVLIVNVIH